MSYRTLEVWRLAREASIAIHKMTLTKLPKFENLVYAHASCDETTDHLETLFETGSLADVPLHDQLLAKLDLLGRKISKFIDSVQTGHRSPK
jgi:hypothetical protein